jgi:hypothetical protein
VRSTILGIALLPVSIGFAPVSSGLEDVSLPDTKKGIWAITVDRDIVGQQPKHTPERAGTHCDVPSDSTNENLASMKRNRCNVQLESQSQSAILFTLTCQTPPGYGNSANVAMQISIESSNPAEYKVTTTTEHGQVVMTGRWLSECAPGN